MRVIARRASPPEILRVYGGLEGHLWLTPTQDRHHPHGRPLAPCGAPGRAGGGPLAAARPAGLLFRSPRGGRGGGRDAAEGSRVRRLPEVSGEEDQKVGGGGEARASAGRDREDRTGTGTRARAHPQLSVASLPSPPRPAASSALHARSRQGPRHSASRLCAGSRGRHYHRHHRRLSPPGVGASTRPRAGRENIPRPMTGASGRSRRPC